MKTNQLKNIFICIIKKCVHVVIEIYKYEKYIHIVI